MRTNGEYSAGLPNGALWRQSRSIDTVENDAARFLDLAGFADGRLDADDTERVAELLANDPAIAADIAAARMIAATTAPFEPAPEAIIARACTLVADAATQSGTVIGFPQSRRRSFRLHDLARWGSLAAAVVVAGWLGFTLGMDTSQSLDGSRLGEEGFLHELFEPATGFLHDLPGNVQT